MVKTVITLVGFVVLCNPVLLCQCPGKDSLWKSIGFTRTAAGMSADEKLSVLLKYESGMIDCPYGDDSTHIFLLKTIGAIYYGEADFLKAVKYYKQAIEIINRNADNPAVNFSQLPGTYYWLSKFYESLGMSEEKIRALDSCALTAIRLNSIDRASLWALYARVEYFYDRGDYHRCIDYATLCETMGNEYANIEESVGNHYTSSSLAWHVNALLDLKKPGEAENLLTGKAREFRKKGAVYNIGVIYEQLAQVEISRGNYGKSLLYFNEAFDSEKKAKHDVNCRTILNNIGHDLYFKRFNDIDKAFDYYKKALAYRVKDTTQNKLNAIETLSILNNIANAYVVKASYDSAYKYFQLAFDQIKPGIGEHDLLYSSLEEFPLQKKVGYIAKLLIDKGNAFRQQYASSRQLNHLRTAVEIYKVADQFLDRVKSDQSDLKSKLFWRSQSRTLYENAISACHANGNVSDAFYFFEKSRAVLLMDQLNEQHWLKGEDILKQTQLKKRILRLENEYNNNIKPDDARRRQLQDNLFEAKQELDLLVQDIKKRNPLYYQSFLDSNMTTLNQVQKVVLSDHHAFVEIFNGDSAVYVLVITAGAAKLSRVDKSIFDSLSRLAMNDIANRDMLNRSYDQFISRSWNLFRLIFENNSIPNGRVIISPDGKYFPFEALVTATQPVTYFLNDHSVSYTYSARYLMNQFTSSPGITARNFMGLAPVQYAGHLQLATLGGSDLSLRQIGSYFSSPDNLVERDASKNNFMQQFYKYKVIQVYSHASDSSNTGEPVIWFVDSTLYLSDLITNYQPVTNLIVLSACETGAGFSYEGEGVFNFNRGFAALGIPSAITNLWSIDNVSTYQLTELFYKYLAQGLPIDISLQKAKLEFINNSPKEKSLPYYWAATILAGKTDPIELKKNFSRTYFALALLLAGSLSFWGFRRWTRRNKAYTPVSKQMPADTISSS